MRYVAGIDGGASKTRCLIGDLDGNILGDYSVGPSNHQTIGEQQAKAAIGEVYAKALEKTHILHQEVEFIYLGLSGADMPYDFDLLNGWCAGIFAGTPFQVVNDAWIGMRSGLKGRWGAVSICGTGSNAGACHPDGRKIILNALSYELGNYGGGGHIAEKALHYAFRAYEGTGKDTALVNEIPKLLDAAGMEDLMSKFYPKRLINAEALKKVPPLVFKLANERDWICQQILVDMGHVLGEMVAGVIKRSGMEELEVPVVLGGSIYKGNNPLLIDELTTALHRVVPKAYITIPAMPPAAGAYLSALDSIGAVSDQKVYDTLERYFNNP